MKKHKIFIAALILGLFVVLPAAAQKTEKEFLKMYTDFLKKKGFNPSVNDGGYVVFTKDNLAYFITPAFRNSPMKFQIVAIIAGLEKYQYQKLLAAANETNIGYFGIKITILDNGKSALVSSEMSLSSPKVFQIVFELVMTNLIEAEKSFIEKL